MSTSEPAPPYRSVAEWVRDFAYAPDDIVLGPHSTLDAEGYEAIHALLDLADPDWRTHLVASLSDDPAPAVADDAGRAAATNGGLSAVGPDET